MGFGLTQTVFLAVILIGGAAAALDLSSAGIKNSSTIPANTDNPTPATCTSTFPDGLVLQTGEKTTTNVQGQLEGQLQERLFTVSPGSTALLCVSYQVNSNEVAALVSSSGITEKFFGSIYRVYAETLGGGWEYNYTAAPGVSVTANPSSIVVHPGENATIQVTYTISTSSSSTGYYNLEYYNQCPAFIPFAVLGTGQGANASNFPVFFQPLDCPRDPILSSGVVTGITDMNISWVSG